MSVDNLRFDFMVHGTTPPILKTISVPMRSTSELDGEPSLVVEEGGTNFLSPMMVGDQALWAEHRKRKSSTDQKSVHPSDVKAEEAKGWTVQRAGKRATRLKRPKRHNRRLEDRVWCLFYAMGYKRLNGERFTITFRESDRSLGKKEIDVYAEDGDVAIVIECKSREERGRRTLQKDLRETACLQKFVRESIQSRSHGSARIKVIWLYATSNILWSEPDIARAQAHNISVITENELQYFETFVSHLGPAAKYQVLGEFLRGQKVPGLAGKKLPAIRGKIAGETFYSFVTTPRDLLKIAFINHQALNHPDGRPAYQRMVSSKRIKDIGSFIDRGGFFPTNILANFSEPPRFDLIPKTDNADPNLKFGWITLPQRYRSAWIIDGQHRLYGYSAASEKNLDRSLFVLGFEGMPVQKEADLFITINHKQKSVPKSLLVSLLADIRMGDSDPSTALSALASATVRSMNTDRTSPLSRRFAVHGVPPEPSQNLTISEAVNGLRRSGLIGKLAGTAIAAGPFSAATDDKTVRRASFILNAYFEALRSSNPVRWEAGREAFVAVNPGIRAHLTVIAEAITFLSHKKGIDFYLANPEEVSTNLIDFCQPIFSFVRIASDEEIKARFSRKFGEGGVKEYAYELMKILSEKYPGFGSEEFQHWVQQSSSEKIDEVNSFLMKLAERLTDFVIDTLKKVHGTHRLASDEPAFWEIGVESERIRKNAFEAQQRDKTRRKPKEAYLNIVDLAEIVKQKNNWDHFEHVFKNARQDERAGQKYYVSWIDTFNELRNIAAHKNKLKTYQDEDLEFVDWLRSTVAEKIPR